jgi:hypothetical protein
MGFPQNLDKIWPDFVRLLDEAEEERLRDLNSQNHGEEIEWTEDNERAADAAMRNWSRNLVRKNSTAAKKPRQTSSTTYRPRSSA